MQRRKLLLLAPIAPLGFLLSRHLKAMASKPPKPVDARGEALRLNQLATSIQTTADARLFVDFVADIFAENLLPAWGTGSMRQRVAEAEFAAVSDRQKLIPEQRLARAWNGYVQAIHAPQENEATAAEVHNLRDAFLSSANYFWQTGNRTLWTAPGIYAAGPDGIDPGGCRAIESVRILWDLANMPANLQAARSRVHEEQLVSDQVRRLQDSPERRGGFITSTVEARERNPVEHAAQQFVARKGIREFSKVVAAMLETLLPA